MEHLSSGFCICKNGNAKKTVPIITRVRSLPPKSLRMIQTWIRVNWVTSFSLEAEIFRLKQIAKALQDRFPVSDLFTVLSILPPRVRAVCLSAVQAQLSKSYSAAKKHSAVPKSTQLYQSCNYNPARNDNLGETLVEKFEKFIRIPLSPLNFSNSTVSSRNFGKLEQNIQFHIFPSRILHLISKYGMTRS